MILADTTADYSGRIIVGVITFLITTVLAAIFSKFKARKQLVADVAERYIEEMSASSDDSSVRRLGAMQRAGVGLFHNDRDIERFAHVVIGRGCTHPCHESDIGDFVLKNKLPTFLRGASARGIRFTDDMVLYQTLVTAMTEGEERDARKSRKRT